MIVRRVAMRTHFIRFLSRFSFYEGLLRLLLDARHKALKKTLNDNEEDASDAEATTKHD